MLTIIMLLSVLTHSLTRFIFFIIFSVADTFKKHCAAKQAAAGGEDRREVRKVSFFVPMIIM